MERRIIMKFMSWNVNGLRAALRHGFVNTFTDLDADILEYKILVLSQMK